MKKKERPQGLEPSFASGLNFYKLFWIFFISCFLGVLVEMGWCLLTRHTLESRTGLVFGQFNPVYGFGALILTVCLFKAQDRRFIWIFLISALIGGVFEYVCSLFQERAFGTVSWDYSGSLLGIHGRTNLLYCAFWGILGAAWIKLGYPRMSRLIERIPNRYGVALSWVLILFMLVNITVSAAAVRRQSERREGIAPSGTFEHYLDDRFSDERLQQIYPNMMVVE